MSIYIFLQKLSSCAATFGHLCEKRTYFDWYNDAFLLDKWWSENDQQLIIREIKYPLSKVDWHTFACLLSILNQFRSFVCFTINKNKINSMIFGRHFSHHQRHVTVIKMNVSGLLYVPIITSTKSGTKLTGNTRRLWSNQTIIFCVYYLYKYRVVIITKEFVSQTYAF